MPSAWASACWLPIALQAFRTMSGVMGRINAQTASPVNAYTDNGYCDDRLMGKQPESEPSEFWKRLTEAWERCGLPTSQNGIAMKLDMSQGSTRRWFTGDGYPEIKVLRDLAEMGNVTVDWLLLGTQPKHPIGERTPLGRFLQLWNQLDEAGHMHLIRAASGQIALRQTEPAKSNRPGSTHSNQKSSDSN